MQVTHRARHLHVFCPNRKTERGVFLLRASSTWPVCATASLCLDVFMGPKTRLSGRCLPAERLSCSRFLTCHMLELMEQLSPRSQTTGRCGRPAQARPVMGVGQMRGQILRSGLS